MGSLKSNQGKKITNQLLWLWNWKRISVSRIRAPKMEWLILYKKLRRQEKSKPEPNRKLGLGADLWALKEHLCWPSMKNHGPSLAWRNPQAQLAEHIQQVGHSFHWSPHYTKLYPYLLFIFYCHLRGRYKCFPKKCLSFQQLKCKTTLS